jgi:hypothetical protein
VGVQVPSRWSRLEASAAWRVRLGAGAAEALERELERLRRKRRLAGSLTLAELVEVYLAQHDVERSRSRSCVGCWARRSLPSVSDQSTSSARRTSPPGGSRSHRRPLRRDPGVAAGARAGGRLGNDRRQPGEARCGQPIAAASGAAPVRVLGRAWGAQTRPRTGSRRFAGRSISAPHALPVSSEGDNSRKLDGLATES